MIVHDPWIRLHQRGLTFRAIFVVLTGACLFACMVSRFIPGLSPFWQTLTTASSIFIGWVFVLATFWFLRARNVLKQRRQQQQKLLAGDVGQLAREQPSPNQHALPLPTKIALRNRISVSTYLLYGALVFVALLLAGLTIWPLVAFFTTPYDAYYTADDPIVAAFLGDITLYLAMLLWVVWTYSRYWVKVTAGGLQARFNGRRMQLAWRDAGVFSVSGVLGPKEQRTYTLSGEQGSVSWIQVMSETPFGLQTTLPFDLYQQQSQALLEVVAGQTSLPLYDMRLPADAWQL